VLHDASYLGAQVAAIAPAEGAIAAPGTLE
jgi:hypothetical protein